MHMGRSGKFRGNFLKYIFTNFSLCCIILTVTETFQKRGKTINKGKTIKHTKQEKKQERKDEKKHGKI